MMYFIDRKMAGEHAKGAIPAGPIPAPEPVPVPE
jgi:hypothetical protein